MKDKLFVASLVIGTLLLASTLVLAAKLSQTTRLLNIIREDQSFIQDFREHALEPLERENERRQELYIQKLESQLRAFRERNQ